MDAVEFVNKKVNCRKPHRCIWCGERMSQGEEAIYRKGIYDGNFFSEHFHLECYEAMTKSDFGYEDGFAPMEQLRGKTYEESHA